MLRAFTLDLVDTCTRAIKDMLTPYTDVLRVTMLQHADKLPDTRKGGLGKPARCHWYRRHASKNEGDFFHGSN